MDPVYVSVIGGGRCTDAERALAEEVGRLLARRGVILVCGGLSGIMEAAAQGAKEVGGTTIGILPGHDRSAANPFLDFVLTTGIGHARNLAVVSSGDAVIAVGGEYGTLSEIALAAALGRPVTVLGGWRLDHDRGLPGMGHELRYASSAQEAVDTTLQGLGGLPPDDEAGSP